MDTSLVKLSWFHLAGPETKLVQKRPLLGLVSSVIHTCSGDFKQAKRATDTSEHVPFVGFFVSFGFGNASKVYQRYIAVRGSGCHTFFHGWNCTAGRAGVIAGDKKNGYVNWR